MIGANNIGNAGRIGNQLFQFASLVGIARKNQYDYCIPSNKTNAHQVLEGCFKLPNIKFGCIDGKMVKESRLVLLEDNTWLHGHFEDYRLFENVEDEVRNNLVFHDHIKAQAINYFESRNINHAIAVVVRRGDFLNLMNCHPVCKIEYYNNCLAQINNQNKRQVIIISDDIKWCKKNFKQPNIHFLDFTPPNIEKQYFDLCVGSMCDDYVISNSTFAWWIAWLGRKSCKKVLIPDPWFGRGYRKKNTDGLYLPNWQRVTRKI